MARSERLLHLTARLARNANARGVRSVAQVLLLAGLVFVLLRLHSVWRDSHVNLRDVGWAALIGSVALAAGTVVASSFIWLAILRRLGVETQAHWVGVYFQAQLGKYIPGSLWQYAGRTALARTSGIPFRPLAISLPIEIVCALLAGALWSTLLLGWWGVVAVFAVLVTTWALTTKLPRGAANARAVALAFELYLVAWPLSGLGFWLTARALVATPLHDLGFYTGAFALAWIGGVVAIYAPGGLGVREAILVALLRGKIGSADAVVVAAVSRAVFALGDVVLAVAGFLLLRYSSRQSSSPTASTARITPGDTVD